MHIKSAVLIKTALFILYRLFKSCAALCAENAVFADCAAIRTNGGDGSLCHGRYRCRRLYGCYRCRRLYGRYRCRGRYRRYRCRGLYRRYGCHRCYGRHRHYRRRGCALITLYIGD